MGILAPVAQGGPLARTVAVAGVVSQSTGYPVLPDTLFQIGSISKIWTAVLVMQLVDEGLLHLEDRLSEVLPGLQVRDASGAEVPVTIRSMLCHTSGIEGDLFFSEGPGDDAVARYCRKIVEYPALTPVYGPMSYSNGAYVLLGRVVEVLRGCTWDEALARYLVRPAGLTDVETLPERVLLHSSALGHYRSVPSDDPIMPAPVAPTDTWNLPRATGPCGNVSASAYDALELAAIFLNGGVATNGVRVLSEASCALMVQEQVSLREQGVENLGWGLGWQLPNWGDEPAYGHGGATEGQRARLVVFPRRRFALLVLTNADAGSAMAGVLVRALTEPYHIGPQAEAHPLKNGTIPAETAAQIMGHYCRPDSDWTLLPGGPSGVTAVIEPDSDSGGAGVQLRLPLRPTAEGYFAVQRPSDRTPTEVAVVRRGDDRWLASSHRLAPLVAETDR